MPFVSLPIDGGLDLITAPQAVQPGKLTDCLNYEVSRQRGIRRIDGYEKFDGGNSPSIYTVNWNGFVYLAGATGDKTAHFAPGTSINVTLLNSVNGHALVVPAFVVFNQNTYDGSTTTFAVWYALAQPINIPTNLIITTDVVEVNVSSPISLHGITINVYGSGGMTNANLLSAAQAVYTNVSASIQAVPGQGNVNGLFWLKDKLYAVRDYLTFNFTAGTIAPNVGDVLYQGASFGAATWIGTVIGVNVTSGSWTGTGAGNAAGTVMVYNLGGSNGPDLAPSGTVNNNTQSVTAILTAGTSGASHAPAAAAGLYQASGGRGSTASTRSWQWMDLGFNIGYKSGLVDFTDMNLAITTSQSPQYVVTNWKTATTGNNGGWINSTTPTGTFPTDVQTGVGATNGFVYHFFQSGGNSFKTSGILNLSGFGFTDFDIPTDAAVTGIEIQMHCATNGLTGSFTAAPIDSSLTIGPVASGPQNINLASTVPFTVVGTGTDNGAAYSNYGSFVTRDIGAPAEVPNVPTSKLGYTGLTAADLKNPNFSINYRVGQTTNASTQHMFFMTDQVRIRASYLPVGNGIYFWNGVANLTVTDGHMTANDLTNTLTSATANFTAAMVGQTVTVSGAGAGGTLLTAFISTFVNSTTVTLSVMAVTTVTTATVNTYTAVRAQVVQHYQLSGTVGDSTAAGQLYIQFVNILTGVVGGPPVRLVLANETIRSWPSGGAAPDGGVADASLLLAKAATNSAPNVMDCSTLLNGQAQPDGSLSPPSKYQSITQNFYATSGLDAIYGVSGGGPAFFYDGPKVNTSGATVPGNFCRILTGLPLQYEIPRSICAHQGHIVLGYYAGLVQWGNAVNVVSFDPTRYDRTAGNNGLGDQVTTLGSVNGDTLFIGTKKRVHMMQGNFNAPSTLYDSLLSPNSGNIEYTLQPMAQYVFCDFRGLTTMATTNKYGDFEIGHLSSQVSTWIIPRVQLSSFFESGNTGIINSVLVRNKNQYRAYFADGYVLTMTFLVDGEPPQFTIQYYTHSGGTTPLTFDVVQAFTESLGRDRIFCATADGTGVVYEVDRSNTFNGAAINAFATLVPDVGQVPYQNKLFSGLNVFGQAQDYATFTISRSANYKAPTQATGGNIINETFGSSAVAPTGLIAPFASYGTSALQLEGTAIGIRFDSNGLDPAGVIGPQFPHVIQAISYTVDPAQIVQQ